MNELMHLVDTRLDVERLIMFLIIIIIIIIIIPRQIN